MSEPKTIPNNQSVNDFISTIENDVKRQDCLTLIEIMTRLTGETPKMWGDSIVGFGTYHYKYQSGREGDWFLTGFSPRKANLTVYTMSGFDGAESLLEKIGKHKKSVSCLYVKKLADVDIDVLEKLIVRSINVVKKRYAEFN